jgi:hypothetical protein
MSKVGSSRFSLYNSGLKSRKLEWAPVVWAVAIFQLYRRWNYVEKTREVRNYISLFIAMRAEFYQMRWIWSVLYILNCETFWESPGVRTKASLRSFTRIAHPRMCVINGVQLARMCRRTGCERLARPATELPALQMVVRLAAEWQFRSSHCCWLCVWGKG